jgi:hypothetical protein
LLYQSLLAAKLKSLLNQLQLQHLLLKHQLLLLQKLLKTLLMLLKLLKLQLLHLLLSNSLLCLLKKPLMRLFFRLFFFCFGLAVLV